MPFTALLILNVLNFFAAVRLEGAVFVLSGC